MPNASTISFSEILHKTLNATWNISQNTMLLNTKNELISVLIKLLNVTQNAIAEHDLPHLTFLKCMLPQTLMQIIKHCFTKR